MVPIESSKLFHTLPEADLARVRAATRKLSFDADEQIFKAGDPGDGIYILESGAVHITAIVAEGDRRVLSRLGPGDMFGEMAVLDNDPRSATATAEKPTSLFFIEREKLLHLLECTPKLSACLVREISRRLRDSNQHYIQEVLQSERLSLIGRFARSIVHDLKNPLNIIGISAEIAGMEKATPESRLVAKNRIRKQVERISNMVNELLEFSRGQQTSFVLATADYSTFVKQLVEELKPEVGMRSVTIEFENPPPSLNIQINPPRLSRVFQNLVHNAVDAMPEGGAIKMRFNVAQNEIVTEVEDSGSGIAPEMADKLFEAFATYGKAHGTGLGLSICKKIIEDHRGTISARCEPGRGAIFVFTLPVLENSPSDNP